VIEFPKGAFGRIPEYTGSVRTQHRDVPEFSLGCRKLG
jgi:hypothetical protein